MRAMGAVSDRWLKTGILFVSNLESEEIHGKSSIRIEASPTEPEAENRQSGESAQAEDSNEEAQNGRRSRQERRCEAACSGNLQLDRQVRAKGHHRQEYGAALQVAAGQVGQRAENSVVLPRKFKRFSVVQLALS